MLEVILERIAVALETIAGAPIGTSVVPTDVAAAVATANAAEPKKTARGRPAKISAKEKETATPGETAPTGDFLEEKKPAAKTNKAPVATVDDVRAALKTLASTLDPASGTPFGMGPARALLGEYGDGAVRLQEETKLGDDGKVGILAEEYYGAVIEAAKKAAKPVAAAEEF